MRAALTSRVTRGPWRLRERAGDGRRGCVSRGQGLELGPVCLHAGSLGLLLLLLLSGF